MVDETGMVAKTETEKVIDLSRHFTRETERNRTERMKRVCRNFLDNFYNKADILVDHGNKLFFVEEDDSFDCQKSFIWTIDRVCEKGRKKTAQQRVEQMADEIFDEFCNLDFKLDQESSFSEEEEKEKVKVLILQALENVRKRFFKSITGTPGKKGQNELRERIGIIFSDLWVGAKAMSGKSFKKL